VEIVSRGCGALRRRVASVYTHNRYTTRPYGQDKNGDTAPEFPSNKLIFLLGSDNVVVNNRFDGYSDGL
jgi:hypothetical protein